MAIDPLGGYGIFIGSDKWRVRLAFLIFVVWYMCVLLAADFILSVGDVAPPRGHQEKIRRGVGGAPNDNSSTELPLPVPALWQIRCDFSVSELPLPASGAASHTDVTQQQRQTQK